LFQAVPEEVDLGRNEKCEFIPFAQPKGVKVTADGRITALECYRVEKTLDGKIVVDKDSDFDLKCDFVISAYGSALGPFAEACKPVVFDEDGNTDYDTNTGMFLFL